MGNLRLPYLSCMRELFFGYHYYGFIIYAEDVEPFGLPLARKQRGSLNLGRPDIVPDFLSCEPISSVRTRHNLYDFLFI